MLGWQEMRPLTFQSLRLMADGEFHSGVAMARQLGVSRASVWIALNEAQAAGVAFGERPIDRQT